MDNVYVRELYTRSPARQSYIHPQDGTAEVTIEREHFLRRPSVSSEQRIVELRRRPGLSPPEHRRLSRSIEPQNRGKVVAPKGRRRRQSITSDSDSDYDSDGSSPRRVRSPRHYEKHLPVARAAPVHAHHHNRSRSIGPSRSRSQGPPGPPGPPRRYDSESDSSSHSDGGKKAQLKPPPKQLLYTGLACVATIAAANNIYQSAKAHHTRKQEFEDGTLSSAEAEKLKAQARKLDLISLGVAAVGVYNVRNGWRRAEGHWKAHREKQAEESG